MPYKGMIRNSVKSLARAFGYEIKKYREPLPLGTPINVFDLCANELTEQIKRPFVLQIGANDGVVSDPIHWFITSNRCPVLLIEPQPAAFAQLKKTYNDFPDVQARNFAISDRAGVLPFYVPSPSLLSQHPHLSGLGTFSRQQLEKELIREDKYSPENILETSVIAKTVPDLLRDESISHIDVIQIDTEGHDWRILSQFDLIGLDVSLIQMEFFHLARADQVTCVNHLTALSYSTSIVYGDIVAYKRPSLFASAELAPVV